MVRDTQNAPADEGCGRAPGGAPLKLHRHLHSSEDASAGGPCHALSAARGATRNEDLLWMKSDSIRGMDDPP